MTKNKIVKRYFLYSPNLNQRKYLPISVTNQRTAKLKGSLMAKELKLSFYSVVEEITTRTTKVIYDRRIHT